MGDGDGETGRQVMDGGVGGGGMQIETRVISKI